MRLIGVIIVLVLLGQESLGSTALEAWNSLLSEKSQKNAAFSFVENDPSLPNVLIYGDSISIHYTEVVRSELSGKANVYRLYCNGSNSGTVIDGMTLMHETMRDDQLEGHWDFDWDLIQFNFGLHDLKYLHNGSLDLENGEQVNSPETYEQNLRNIIGYLKDTAPAAVLVFATTTPVPEGSKGRLPQDAVRYNKVALKVLGDYPEIVVNDLYSFTLPHHAEWWSKPGNVHYNPEGRTAQGKEVARIILEELN